MDGWMECREDTDESAKRVKRRDFGILLCGAERVEVRTEERV